MSRQCAKKFDEQQLEKMQQSVARLVCSMSISPRSCCDKDGSIIQMINALNPMFSPYITFESLERNCLKIYDADRERVKQTFSKLGGQISFSMDSLVEEKSWESFYCICAHFIDDDWNLKKWVIKYNSDFPGDTILELLKEYDIEDKMLTVNVGNDSDFDNDVKENIQKVRKLPLDGQLFHVQCCSDMISHMVQIGFEEISEIIDKVHMLSWSKSLPLWYLTSSKLSSALVLNDMGEFSSENVGDFYEVPTDDEWGKVRNMCRIADRIYEITKELFEFKRQTANLFLPHLQEIRTYLTQESASSDEFVRLVTEKMLKILNEYWNDMCLLLSVAAFLDPRYKMKYVEFCLSEAKATTVLETIRELYNGYVVQSDEEEYELSDSSSDEEEEEDEEEVTERLSEKKCGSISEKLNGLKEYCETTKNNLDMSHKSDLELYLEEPVYPWKENFSVLHWWKRNCSKYPRLAKMAQDFLAIPMSVATSYNAYYTEQREADWTVMSLKPELTNALMCTRSWKFDPRE